EDSVFTLKSGTTLQGHVRLDSIENIEVDVEGSGMVSCTINFTGHGTFPATP
ncbi:unnamed protein product, partial [marine sediment metagenome]